jgi:DNA-binding XRE family transcriptional regulator
VPTGVYRLAGLLRQLRGEARLTQEELAQAAGLSPRSVSDLERGINRTARKDTAPLPGRVGPCRSAETGWRRSRGFPGGTSHLRYGPASTS